MGKLTLIDRDFVEESNLQRQSLFTEQDAQRGLPKAAAAQRALRAINSDVEVKGVIEDVTWQNIDKLCQGCDLIVDGTDNFETRFLINDFAVKREIPGFMELVWEVMEWPLPSSLKFQPVSNACLSNRRKSERQKPVILRGSLLQSFMSSQLFRLPRE